MLTCLAIIAGLALTAVLALLVVFIVCWIYVALHPELADAPPPNSEPH